MANNVTMTMYHNHGTTQALKESTTVEFSLKLADGMSQANENTRINYVSTIFSPLYYSSLIEFDSGDANANGSVHPDRPALRN